MSERRVTRRGYLADLAALGAVLVGSAVCGVAAGGVDALPGVPLARDRVRAAGSPAPAQVQRGGVPASTPTPTPTPRPPRERDRVPPAGSVVAPPPPLESDHVMAPGKVAAPPPRAPRR